MERLSTFPKTASQPACHQGSLGTVPGCWEASGPLGTEPDQRVLSVNWWQMLRARTSDEAPPLLLSEHPVLPVGLKRKAWVPGALAHEGYRENLEVGVATLGSFS